MVLFALDFFSWARLPLHGKRSVPRASSVAVCDCRCMEVAALSDDQKVRVLCRLGARKPRAVEKYREAVASGTTFTALDHDFSPELIRRAIEQLDAESAGPVASIDAPIAGPSEPPAAPPIEAAVEEPAVDVGAGVMGFLSATTRSPASPLEEPDEVEIAFAEAAAVPTWRPGFSQCDLEGHVSLKHDRVANLWFVENALTREIKKLPVAAEWALDIDGPEAWVVEVKIGDPNQLDLYKVFDAIVYQSDDDPGAERVVRRLSNEIPIEISFTSYLNEHHYAVFGLKTTLSSSIDSFNIACFQVPRCGQRVWWDLACLYDVLEFNRKGSTAGGFIQDRYPAWERLMGDFMLTSGEFLKSIQYESYRVRDGDDDRRVLKFVSGTSTAVLILLAKWIACSAGAGGVSSESEKKSCADVLDRLLLATRGGAFKFSLFTGTDLQVDGDIVGTSPVTISVAADGACDLSELFLEAWGEFGSNGCSFEKLSTPQVKSEFSE